MGGHTQFYLLCMEVFPNILQVTALDDWIQNINN